MQATAAVPAFGLKPGETDIVNATISAQTYPPGTYRVTAVLAPKIFEEPGSNGLLHTATLTINATIVD